MKFLNNFLLISCATFIFMLAAVYNGFPIVYSDTSTYIESGFSFIPPFDRPISYGIFIYITSLFGLSLWFVVIIQSLLISLLLYVLCKEFLPAKGFGFRFILLIFLVGILSGLDWVSSQLIADIFTPAVVLTLIVILLKNNASLYIKILLFIFYFFAVSTHISHLNLSVTLIILLIIIRTINFYNLKSIIELRTLLLLLAVTLLTYPTMSAAISKSKNIILMGAMVEHGIVRKYLDENCNEKQFRLCLYKDSLPNRAFEFIWDENSPLYKTGGWKENRMEFERIIHGTLSKPRYLGWHIKASIKATLQQLVEFRMGDGNGPFRENTLLYRRVQKHFPGEINKYVQSRQNKDHFYKLLLYFNKIQFVFILLSFVLVFLLLAFRWKSVNDKLKLLSIVFTLTILINSWICGTFSGAAERYGLRIIWFIPFLLIILILNLKAERFKFIATNRK